MVSAGPQQQRPTRRVAFSVSQTSHALLEVGLPAVSAQVCSCTMQDLHRQYLHQLKLNMHK